MTAAKAGSLQDPEFVPLANFQQGSLSYRNTCFIAVVINLRGLIPAIDEVLGLSALTWKETIAIVRAKWGNKYAYTDEFNGQDDAAELLGDLLWDAPAYRLSCKKTIKYHQCQHVTESQQSLCMLVLSMPEQEVFSYVSDLLKRYMEPVALYDLKHEDPLCGVCDQEGVSTLSFEGVQPDTCVLRINRYSAGLQRRSDQVYPDPMLVLGDSSYSLQAVIAHQGDSTHHGHYIMYLRSSQGWERRDDAACTLVGNDTVPPCNLSELYVVIYKKVEALSLSEALTAQRTRADAERRRVELDRRLAEEARAAERRRLAEQDRLRSQQEERNRQQQEVRRGEEQRAEQVRRQEEERRRQHELWENAYGKGGGTSEEARANENTAAAFLWGFGSSLPVPDQGGQRLPEFSQGDIDRENAAASLLWGRAAPITRDSGGSSVCSSPSSSDTEDADASLDQVEQYFAVSALTESAPKGEQDVVWGLCASLRKRMRQRPCLPLQVDGTVVKAA